MQVGEELPDSSTQPASLSAQLSAAGKKKKAATATALSKAAAALAAAAQDGLQVRYMR